MYDKRMVAVNYIVDNYLTREKRQEDFANELNITVQQLRMVTKNAHIFHGIRMTPDNLKEGQSLPLVSFFDGDGFSFLDDIIIPV